MTTGREESRRETPCPFRFQLGPLFVKNRKLENKGAIDVLQNLLRALSLRRVDTILKGQHAAHLPGNPPPQAHIPVALALWLADS